MKTLLTLTTVIGFTVPYSILAIFIGEHGLNVPLLFNQVFASYGSTFFAADVILAALFIIGLSAYNKDLGRKRYFVIFAVLLVGPSCALPLYYRLKY